MNKFKSGDRVKIVNYGAILYEFRDGKYYKIDLMPQLVGKVVTIDKVTITQEIPFYSVIGVSKTAWYTENQFEKMN